MARLVARALRLGRSALLQTGATVAYRGGYRLSYLMPALVWPGPLVLVVPETIHQHLLQDVIPHLLETLPTIKSIQVGDRWPDGDFQGILVTTPQAWLAAQLSPEADALFPKTIVTLFDGIDSLADWIREQLTCRLDSTAWQQLNLAYPGQRNVFDTIRVRLTRSGLQRPTNPYGCYLLDQDEHQQLLDLFAHLSETALGLECLPPIWARFHRRFSSENAMVWLRLHRDSGQISLCCAPVDLAAVMAPVWERQPLVLVGAAVDADPRASIYRQQLGLGDLTCLKFGPDRHQEGVQLYAPDRLPMPNSSQFSQAVLQETRSLLQLPEARTQLTVIIVGDSPLKNQVGSILAAEYGSRVQVERERLAANGILVTGWEFWLDYRLRCPAPVMTIVVTLPIPSLENPLVAARVSYHKRLRQDWFRLFLLPAALQTLQLAIAPTCARQGKVALLDNRINHRSYGRVLLDAIAPTAQTSYLDETWLAPINQQI